nr:hypothetical protein [Tanacetum cinerariifolium]
HRLFNPRQDSCNLCLDLTFNLLLHNFFHVVIDGSEKFIIFSLNGILEPRNTDAQVGRVGKISLGIGVRGIGGWLAVVVFIMMDGVIVDLGEASVRSTSEGSVGLVALAVIVGVGVVIGVGGVVDEAEPPFFFLALVFGFGAASPVAQA